MVTEDGMVDIRVQGLVLTETGANPSAEFGAIVSCETATGAPENVMTGLFPADMAGNAVIKDQVVLPIPCIAPIVFITSPAGDWFAVTGSSGMATPAMVGASAGMPPGAR